MIAVDLVFRAPKLSDAPAGLEYINSLVEEQTFIGVQKKLNLAKEKDYIKMRLRQKKECRGDIICAFDGSKIVGSAHTYVGEHDATAHVAMIGIGVHKDYRRKGLGTELMKKIIRSARKLKGIDIIQLTVSVDNRDAINFYKKLGFKKVGKVKNALKRNGKLVDEIFMQYFGD